MAMTVDEAGRRNGLAVLRSRERAISPQSESGLGLSSIPNCHRDMRVVGRDRSLGAEVVERPYCGGNLVVP